MTYRYFILQISVFFAFWVPICMGTEVYQEDRLGHLIGLSISQAEQENLTREDIARFNELGISILEVEGLIGLETANAVLDYEITIFPRQPRRFTTAHQLQKNDSLFFEKDQELIRFYREHLPGQVTAFGLFTYPHTRSAPTRNLINIYAKELRQSTEPDLYLYYLTVYADTAYHAAAFSFRSTLLEGTGLENLPSEMIHFSPAGELERSLFNLKTVFEKSLEADQSIILLPYSWFNEAVSRYPELEEVIKTYTETERVVFPLPRTAEERVTLNWSVIFLILLLGSYLVHYQSSPTYRRSLFRYFTTHNFFTENLMDKRLRAGVPGLILFFQHLAVVGLFIYLFVSATFSTLGLEALHHHFQFFGQFGIGMTGILLFGITAAFTVQLLSIIWINGLNRRSSFSQVTALYVWGLHINLLIVLIMAGIYHAGGADSWIQTLSILFLLTWFVCFNITALDVARYMTKHRVVYIFFTIGLHAALFIVLVSAFLLYPPLAEPVQLSISLP